MQNLKTKILYTFFFWILCSGTLIGGTLPENLTVQTTKEQSRTSEIRKTVQKAEKNRKRQIKKQKKAIKRDRLFKEPSLFMKSLIIAGIVVLVVLVSFLLDYLGPVIAALQLILAILGLIAIILMLIILLRRRR